MKPNDDDPVTLQEAVDIVYRGTIKVSTLRLEADRGNLEIFKVGRRQFTTLRSVREMQEKCRAKPKARGSTLTGSASNGLSEMERVSSALVALKQTTKALKSSSQNTSRQNTDRPRSHRQ